ncbi:hypothetical protein SAMN05216389_11651 [Oceanobacillus limi]|uniref:YesK-like protein n=1 Tax=Oceanobacillus limi TaxID=930131 RepID=A0A1I0FMY9_9BACI|nr:hypothetical protein [Oceanobacillus limi]SET59750.1 hypothetical protein SAMN05216389_11651 [Oceanobacillus limi]
MGLVQSVITIGAVLTALAILLGFILIKILRNATYIYYFPCLVLFGSGIVFLLAAMAVGKVDIMGAGLGGWGIATLFASGISFMVTTVNDVYARAEEG